MKEEPPVTKETNVEAVIAALLVLFLLSLFVLKAVTFRDLSLPKSSSSPGYSLQGAVSPP